MKPLKTHQIDFLEKVNKSQGGMNIVAYAVNPSMLFAELAVTIAAMIFGFYGIYLLGELKIINRAEENLISMLKRRLSFYRSKYEIWNLMMAIMIPLLSFALITHIDNQESVYRINQPFIFWVVTLLQFIFGYVIIKISQYPILKEIKILRFIFEIPTLRSVKMILISPILKPRFGMSHKA